jgi:protein NUD1
VKTVSGITSQGIDNNSIVAGQISASKRKGHSSLGYRQQAESLMAQLKQDMKGSKRIFSTDATDTSPNSEDASRSIRPLAIPTPPHRSYQNLRSLPPAVQRGNSPRRSLMVPSF